MITSTNGITKVITTYFKAVNFAKEITEWRLNGSVIRETEVECEGFCQLQCVEQNGCLSYIYGINENKKKFKCQLKNSDPFRGLKNFTEDQEFLYWGIITCWFALLGKTMTYLLIFVSLTLFSKFSAPTIAFLAFWLAKKLRLWANSRSFTSYGK